MCTVVLLRRPGHDWPLLIGANRDELTSRPWLAPARHWPDREHVIAGIDQLAGGTWMALNDDGVCASILNRQHSLGPAADKRSRGELPLEAVDHAQARDAAKALSTLDPGSYRSFNLVIADAENAFWLRSTGEPDSHIDVTEIPVGVSMLTARDLNDPQSPRIERHLSRFQSAPAPDPETDDWFTWQGLLATTATAGDSDGRAAMTITTMGDFATVSSSLIALPRRDRYGIKAKWQFCSGRPDQTPYLPVAL
ncbi:MAG: NRDE family protein [Rhodospirillales bacterium]|nr:NRDE family protein [Rhodospirillales bacterium]